MLRPALRYCVKPFTMQLKREIEASGRPPSYYPSSACRLKKSVQTNFLTNMGTPHRLLLLPLLYLFGQCPMHLHASPVVTTSPWPRETSPAYGQWASLSWHWPHFSSMEQVTEDFFFFFNRLIESLSPIIIVLPSFQGPMPHTPTQIVKLLHPPAVPEPDRGKLGVLLLYHTGHASWSYRQRAERCVQSLFSVSHPLKTTMHQVMGMGDILSSFLPVRHTVTLAGWSFSRLPFREQNQAWEILCGHAFFIRIYSSERFGCQMLKPGRKLSTPFPWICPFHRLLEA